MNAKYLGFYLDGREAKLLKHDIDVDELADKICQTGESPHQVLRRAVEDASKALNHDRMRRQWLRDNEEEIKEAGGSDQEAWDHFLMGKVDELIYNLEPALMEALEEAVFGEDGGEDEGDDEDDEDETDHEGDK